MNHTLSEDETFARLEIEGHAAAHQEQHHPVPGKGEIDRDGNNEQRERRNGGESLEPEQGPRERCDQQERLDLRYVDAPVGYTRDSVPLDQVVRYDRAVP